MRTNHAFARLLLSVAYFLSMACGSGESSEVPNDFKLSAHYSPGYSNWKPWKTVITADGNVSQEIQVARSGKEGGSRKTSVLTTNDFQQLFASVRASEFSTLKTNYYYPITDSPTLTLQLTMNGSSHEVNVYAPHHLKDNREVKRFLKVWNEVLKKVPSPNPEQKPE